MFSDSCLLNVDEKKGNITETWIFSARRGGGVSKLAIITRINTTCIYFFLYVLLCAKFSRITTLEFLSSPLKLAPGFCPSSHIFPGYCPLGYCPPFA